MNNETETTCKIIRRNGESARSVVEFVAEQASECVPLLSWAEPEPATLNINGAPGRLKNFEPLVRGYPNWPEDLPLVEARLFWEMASLHVVAKEESGCKWAYLEETSDNTPDKFTLHFKPRVGWLSNLLNKLCRHTPSILHSNDLQLLYNTKKDTQEVLSQAFRVLTITDLARFGLTAAQFTAIDHLMALAYRQQGRLVAWRLIIQKENDHA